MFDCLLYFGCGLCAGILGGYLGLGGGIVMVPYLTLLAGMDIKAAVPVSIAAIAANSLSSSIEYLRKGMVDFELVILLSLFMTLGNIVGSSLVSVVPTGLIRIVFTVVLLYTAIVFLKGRKTAEPSAGSDDRRRNMVLIMPLVLAAGALAGLIGIGGGVVLVPLLYLVIGLPLTTARGTSSFLVGFSAAASTVVFYLLQEIDFAVVGPVVPGILLGGKLGGRLGTLAKPFTVRIVFFFVMIYLAVRLAWGPLSEVLP